MLLDIFLLAFSFAAGVAVSQMARGNKDWEMACFCAGLSGTLTAGMVLDHSLSIGRSAAPDIFFLLMGLGLLVGLYRPIIKWLKIGVKIDD